MVSGTGPYCVGSANREGVLKKRKTRIDVLVEQHTGTTMEPFSFLTGFISFPYFLLGFLFVVLTVEIAYDAGIVAFLTLAFYVAVSVLFGWFRLDWPLEHWREVVFALGCYIPVGVGWTFAKWWFYVRMRAREVKALIAAHKSFSSYDLPPQVGNHKADIIRWLSWWPFSVIGTILNDPFRRLFEAVYRGIAETLQRISIRAFADIDMVGKKDIH
jgi:hypothetical protein